MSQKVFYSALEAFYTDIDAYSSTTRSQKCTLKITN